MRVQPSTAEERWIAARDLVGKSAWIEERIGGWRPSSLLARCGFFFLATICVAAFFGFLIVVFRSGRGEAVVTGVASIAAAEGLILGFRFFGAGFEEALWFWGAIALAAGIGWDSRHLFFLICAICAAGALAAGVRLLNPLFVTAGAIFIALDIAERLSYSAAGVFCAVVAVAALALLPLRRTRPSLDRTLQWLVVAMPATAYLIAKDGHFDFDWAAAAALLVYAIAAALVGIGFRLHAPLLALFPTLAAFAYEVREVSGLSLEVRLIVWGSVLLAVSVVLERILRTPRHGLTSVQLRDDKYTQILQLAGTAAITTHAQPAPGEPGLKTGGGAFGGAGASGDF